MLKNLEFEIGKLRSKVKQAGSDKATATVLTMLAELKIATPVDTGLAQKSWDSTKQSKETFVIKNPVPYIKALNEGSSKQAAPFFVERIALKYGKPIGKITK
jgi:hypothetical protein